MARSLHRLTVKQIEAAPAGQMLNDGGGLYFRATDRGAGRWGFRFTSKDRGYLAAQAIKGSAERRREMGLGAYPGTGLREARDRAQRARDLTGRGLDPIEEARREAEAAQAEAEAAAQAAAADAMTFGRYAEDRFLPGVLAGLKNDKSRAQWRRTFGELAGELKDKPLAGIRRADVLAVIQPMWDATPETASRVRGRFERLFAHAVQNGAYGHDNPAAWTQFDQTLAPAKKLTRGHHAAIPFAKMPELMAALRAKQAVSMGALMLEWIALAACRTGEARFATWGELDLDARVWNLPASRMKAGKPHSVPITDRMGELLDMVRARRTAEGEPDAGELIFPNDKGEALSNMTAAKALSGTAAGKGYTVHGLRSTFRTWAGDAMDFPRELPEAQLAHRLGPVEAAYMRGQMLDRRRDMMEAWAAFCAGQDPAGAANVVPLRAGGAAAGARAGAAG